MDTRAIARATTEILELAGLAVIAVGTVATCVLVLGRAVRRRRNLAKMYDRSARGSDARSSSVSSFSSPPTLSAPWPSP